MQNADKSEEGGVTETLPPVATPDTPLTISFRLVIQSSQCGSLIGKGGTKIKEIREVKFFCEVAHYLNTIFLYYLSLFLSPIFFSSHFPFFTYSILPPSPPDDWGVHSGSRWNSAQLHRTCSYNIGYQWMYSYICMYSGTLLIRRLMGVSKVSIFQGLKNCSWGKKY